MLTSSPLILYPIRKLPDLAGFTAGTALTAANHYAMQFVFIPRTGNISHIGWRSQTSSLVGTIAPDITTMSTTAQDTSGTLYGGCTAGSQVNPASTTVYETALGTAATAVLGDLVCVRYLVSAYTSGSFQLATKNNAGLAVQIPGCRFYTGSLIASPGTTPVLYFKYSDGVIVYPEFCYSVNLEALVGINTGSTPDEFGLQVQRPYPWTLELVRFFGNHVVATDFDIVMYNAAGTVIGNNPIANIDTDRLYGTAYLGHLVVQVSHAPIMAANTPYYIFGKPKTATANNFRLEEITFGSVAELRGYTDDANACHAQRTDAGAITLSTSIHPMMQIGIRKIHNVPRRVFPVSQRF